MELEAFYFLLSPDGVSLLEEYSDTEITPDTHLQLAEELHRKVGAGRANAVLETLLLRRLAIAKFSRAEQMFFTREALEQASAEIVSTYRAQRYFKAGFSILADLGCGIGGDSIALAEKTNVVGVEWDPVRLAMAQENLRLHGHGERFQPLQADLLELSPLPVEALFADPGRRDELGRRVFSVDDYQPPLQYLERWRDQVPHQGVKISPAVDYNELPPDAEVEFISVKGEVREAVLWSGALRTDADRRATLLPGQQTMIDGPAETIPVGNPGAFLFEPDGAIIRAHLVEQLAAQIDASKIDDEIAYLTASQPASTPFARCYRLDDALPFQLKRLRQYLRQRGIGQVTIKKRGSPLNPDQLRHRLRLQGDGHSVIFLTRVAGEPYVLVGDRWMEGE